MMWTVWTVMVGCWLAVDANVSGLRLPERLKAFLPQLFFPTGSVSLSVPLPLPVPPLPLLHLPALPFTPTTPLPLHYSFTGSPYLNSTPDVVFTDAIFSEGVVDAITDGSDVTGFLEVEDTSGGYNKTQIRVQVTSKGCGDLLDELCFWKEVFYSVPENYVPVKLGELGSTYLKRVCPGYDVSYKLLNHTSSFAIISGALHVLRPLERDVGRWRRAAPGPSRSRRDLGVACRVHTPAGRAVTLSTALRVHVLDTDDLPPRLQDHAHQVLVAGRRLQDEQLESLSKILFVDPDTSAVNNYSVYLVGDDKNFFTVHYDQFEVDIDPEHHTALAVKLSANPGTRIPDEGYEVKLVVNDTTMQGGGDSTANLTFRFIPEALATSQPIAENMKKNMLYPPSVELLRTAAMLARVVQPPKNINVTQCRFQLGGSEEVFNVTYKEGIVFVNRVSLLRNLQETFQLEIKWRDKTTNETFSDFVTIHLVNESNSVCFNYSDNVNNWGHCASQGSKKSCEKTCGLGAGSHEGFKNNGHTRCIWRPGTDMYSTARTKYYATCIAEQETCPDLVCDELENAHHWLCPQDCARKVNIPLSPNPITKKGLFNGFGICSCDRVESCYCATPRPTKPPTIATTIAASSATMDYNDVQLQPSNASNHSRIVDPISAPSSPFPPSCGGSCVLAVGGGVLFLLAAASVLAACYRRRRLQDAARRDRKLAAAAVAQHSYTPDSAAEPAVGAQLLIGFELERGGYAAPKMLPVVDSKWEFPREKLRIEQTLGEGEFGRVLRARALEISNMPGYTTVAVKTLKEGARDAELADLMSEYQLLKEVSHPNVIRLLGACTLPGGPVYLVIEFAELGSLRNYLRRSRHLESDGQIPNSAALMMGENEPTSLPACKITPRDVLSFAWQISKGMNYLNDMKLVHRDLAARNVLLSADMVCKISDFGLTRDVYEDDTYLKRTKGRVKWMAPESLADHIYNSKSDVWSFGILLWELVTLGASPYPGVAVQNLFHLLRSGYRMEKPDNCSAILYKIMRVCWCEQPNERPSFRTLMIKFEAMLSDGVDYLDLNPRTVHNRTYFTSLTDALVTPDENEESCGYGNLTLMQPDTVNLDSQPVRSKCAEVDKLQVLWQRPDSPKRSYENQEPAQELHHYESPIKRLHTPTNEQPQSYIDMAGANETHQLLRTKSKELQVSEGL